MIGGNGVSQNQFDALVSFVFNVGAGAFRSSALLRGNTTRCPAS
jgi:GH24 family phage-related lysozyme (muramidase)